MRTHTNSKFDVELLRLELDHSSSVTTDGFVPVGVCTGLGVDNLRAVPHPQIVLRVAPMFSRLTRKQEVLEGTHASKFTQHFKNRTLWARCPHD